MWSNRLYIKAFTDGLAVRNHAADFNFIHTELKQTKPSRLFVCLFGISSQMCLTNPELSFHLLFLLHHFLSYLENFVFENNIFLINYNLLQIKMLSEFQAVKFSFILLDIKIVSVEGRVQVEMTGIEQIFGDFIFLCSSYI